MAISVKAEGLLADAIPPNTTLHDVRSVGEAIERLALPYHSGMVVLVNGRIADWNTALQSGDAIHLIPAIGGGHET